MQEEARISESFLSQMSKRFEIFLIGEGWLLRRPAVVLEVLVCGDELGLTKQESPSPWPWVPGLKCSLALRHQSPGWCFKKFRSAVLAISQVLILKDIVLGNTWTHFFFLAPAKS